MSTSLARSRSLRTRPAVPAHPSSAITADARPETRNGSPSRLPVKPAARVPSTGSNSSSIGTRSSRPPPPVSSSTTVPRIPSSRQPSGGAAQEAARKDTSSRYPPSTASTRPPPGATRPKSSGGPLPPVRKAPMHTRAKSTVTSLNAATSLRPPSREPSGSTLHPNSQPLHRRNVSTNKPLSPTPPPSHHPQNSASTQAQQQRLRPAFSTHQQHYSPVKSLAPKPLTSTYLAPPSPSKLPANIAASAEASKLQAELLQLHLLHRDAAGVDAEWRASAKGKLGQRFSQLCDLNDEVTERERAGVERENVLALRRWTSGSGGLDERIQTLEAIVTGVWSLSEPGGRYVRVSRRFERWIDRVCEVEGARKKGSEMLLQGQDALFIGELDETWKEEREGLICRLEGWRSQLHEIDHTTAADENSDVATTTTNTAASKPSLTRMLLSSRYLMDDMLAELNLMEQIEQEALAREDEWIERMNREEENAYDTPRAGAVWRVV